MFAEIIFCCVWFTLAGINGMVDSDVFYIISTGRYILVHGIPQINPFITTAGVPIVIQNWAYCVMVAWVERTFGTLGLFVMMIFMMGGLYLIVRNLVTKTVHNAWVRLFCAVSLTYIFSYLNLRPEILTFFLVWLELYGIEKYRETNQKKFLCLIPLTLLTEINFHASYWIMHYIVLLPYLVSFPYKRVVQTGIAGKQRRLLVAISLASVPVLLINPYGMHNVTYVFDALASNAFSAIQINELQPLSINNLPYVLPILLSILLFVFGLQQAEEQPNSAARIRVTSVSAWMWGGFLILAVTKVKWYPFFMLGTLYLFRDTGSMVENFLLKISRCVRFDKMTRFVLLLCTAALLIESWKNTKRPMELIVKNQPLTDLYFSRNLGASVLEDWKAVREIVINDTDSRICSLPQAFNHFFEYEGCQVYVDMRPELYTDHGENGQGSIIDNMAALKNMQRIPEAKPITFSFGQKKEEANKTEKTSEFLSASEYKTLVADIPTHYFLLANSYRDSVLRLFLDEHGDEYEKVYDGENMTLFRKRSATGGV